jgi:hypothetical protein
MAVSRTAQCPIRLACTTSAIACEASGLVLGPPCSRPLLSNSSRSARPAPDARHTPGRCRRRSNQHGVDAFGGVIEGVMASSVGDVSDGVFRDASNDGVALFRSTRAARPCLWPPACAWKAAGRGSRSRGSWFIRLGSSGPGGLPGAAATGRGGRAELSTLGADQLQELTTGLTTGTMTTVSSPPRLPFHPPGDYRFIPFSPGYPQVRTAARRRACWASR